MKANPISIVEQSLLFCQEILHLMLTNKAQKTSASEDEIIKKLNRYKILSNSNSKDGLDLYRIQKLLSKS